MCSDVSGSFSLCFWRDLSLVKGAAEVTSQPEIPHGAVTGRSRSMLLGAGGLSHGQRGCPQPI